MPTQVKSWESRGSQELFDKREDAERAEVDWAVGEMKTCRGPAEDCLKSEGVKLAVTILAEKLGLISPPGDATAQGDRPAPGPHDARS